MNPLSPFESFLAGLFTPKPEPRPMIKDVNGTRISITTDGDLVLFWREHHMSPFLTMRVDDAYAMALEAELAVESIDGA